jgi:hypothetical protein
MVRRGARTVFRSETVLGAFLTLIALAGVIIVDLGYAVLRGSLLEDLLAEITHMDDLGRWSRSR